MDTALNFSELAGRHSGISIGVGLSYEEAARVCLDRHHGSPVIVKIRDNIAESEASAEWLVADEALKHAWANEIDTTEAGAYGLALAAIELTRGLVAIRRAETRTGADYYIDVPGGDPDDLEMAIRLEVSGTSDGNTSVIENRLKQKLEQANQGSSNLPAIATVIGFSQLRIVIADLVES